jgi:hypothetical protein
VVKPLAEVGGLGRRCGECDGAVEGDPGLLGAAEVEQEGAPGAPIIGVSAPGAPLCPSFVI